MEAWSVAVEMPMARFSSRHLAGCLRRECQSVRCRPLDLPTRTNRAGVISEAIAILRHSNYSLSSRSRFESVTLNSIPSSSSSSSSSSPSSSSSSSSSFFSSSSPSSSSSFSSVPIGYPSRSRLNWQDATSGSCVKRGNGSAVGCRRRVEGRRLVPAATCRREGRPYLSHQWHFGRWSGSVWGEGGRKEVGWWPGEEGDRWVRAHAELSATSMARVQDTRKKKSRKKMDMGMEMEMGMMGRRAGVRGQERELSLSAVLRPPKNVMRMTMVNTGPSPPMSPAAAAAAMSVSSTNSSSWSSSSSSSGVTMMPGQSIIVKSNNAAAAAATCRILVPLRGRSGFPAIMMRTFGGVCADLLLGGGGGFGAASGSRSPRGVRFFAQAEASSRPAAVEVVDEVNHETSPPPPPPSESGPESGPEVEAEAAGAPARVNGGSSSGTTSTPSSLPSPPTTVRSRGGGDYDASQIQVLEGLDPVRRRPGMYIGSTGPRGLHHLVYEVLDNAIDEAQAGYATCVDVVLRGGGGGAADGGSVCITDNGRGIPTDIHPVTKKSAIETVLTVLHAGGKFGGESSGYRVSGGLHGVGLSVVNALSEKLKVTVWRDGMEFVQTYERGTPTSEVISTPLSGDDEDEKGIPAASSRTGTRIEFTPDRQVFVTSTKIDYGTIASRLRELAFLNKDVTINLIAEEEEEEVEVVKGEEEEEERLEEEKAQEVEEEEAIRRRSSSRGGIEEEEEEEEMVRDKEKEKSRRRRKRRESTFHFAGGLKEYVDWLNSDKDKIHDTISFSREQDGVLVDVAVQWCRNSFTDTLLGYANSIRTTDGGTHLDGLKVALTRAVNSLGRKAKILKEKDENLAGDHIREGLTAVVSVKVPNPEFEGQTKTRLGNPEVRKVVDVVVLDCIQEYLESHPSELEAILNKAIQAFKAAEAAKKARELVRRKNVLKSSTLPGKLSDCTCSDRRFSEIFIVEGDSAGGSAKQGRDRWFQAVLPLRGKILNVEKKDDAAIYKNEEIQNLIIALGLGIKGEEYDLSNLRYDKVIILTDADVDGSHIRTLLLTFLFRYQRSLFENGHVYVGVPPLYKVDRGRSVFYCYDEEELRKLTSKTFPENASYSIQRFKGLGEMMPDQLWETTMDPKRRMLKLLTIEDAVEASRTFTILMGDKVGPRKEMIQTFGSAMQLDKLDV
ncbi:hypothetical protein CBR_g48715 [Chara braunii]|uniref:DNA gyrase subunit B n=1 Tax=Chara braunii TaxID=69332 RepID=A0A388K4M5_CHABU|nr:hypothetical protein CBR_g48715 [Chara braunii]|eukprot:GBG64966.1 hypothetical protein CBR_g48715 [Chara braunii]